MKVSRPLGRLFYFIMLYRALPYSGLLLSGIKMLTSEMAMVAHKLTVWLMMLLLLKTIIVISNITSMALTIYLVLFFIMLVPYDKVLFS